MNAKLLTAALVLLAPLAAQAGAVVKINEDTKIDIGLRLNTQLIFRQDDLRDAGDYEWRKDFNIRRARLRFRADMTKYINTFIQTDFEELGGTAGDARIIDAYILLKPHKLAHFYVGENMVAAIRQEVSSSATHMAIDRPGLAYKSVSWGGRSKFVFTNETFGESNARLPGRVNVRDLGLTLFGNTSPTEMVHLKYYLGVYDGAQTADRDNLRLTARAQVNFFDPESGYYNDSTYLGEKKTIGIGASYDLQDAVARDADTGNRVDYRLYSADAFAELPMGPGSLSAEVGFVSLDLGGGGAMERQDGTALGNASQAQGNGFFAQAGFYLKDLKLQPWLNYEQWKSDADDDRGSYTAFRGGVNYYLRGENANFKAGVEIFKPEVALSDTQDQITSFVLALNVSY